jgi:hypothetical protein
MASSVHVGVSCFCGVPCVCVCVCVCVCGHLRKHKTTHMSDIHSHAHAIFISCNLKLLKEPSIYLIILQLTDRLHNLTCRRCGHNGCNPRFGPCRHEQKWHWSDTAEVYAHESRRAGSDSRRSFSVDVCSPARERARCSVTVTESRRSCDS